MGGAQSCGLHEKRRGFSQFVLQFSAVVVEDLSFLGIRTPCTRTTSPREMSGWFTNRGGKSERGEGCILYGTNRGCKFILRSFGVV
jgi:hypothetical protein